MTVTTRHIERRPVSHVPTRVARLEAAGSQLGRQLTDSLDVPLRTYLKGLIPRRKESPANRHLLRVSDALAQTLHKQGHPDVDDICTQFLNVPVIQQADHSNLLLDEETFLNNLLFAAGCRESGVRWMITSQCSTVSCLSRRNPVAGPVFLRTRGRLHNVFSLSNRTYKNSSFCSLPGPLTIKLNVMSGNYHARRDDPIFDLMVGFCATDAPTAYRICNDNIWSSLDGAATVPRIDVDETMTSHLAADHIEDPYSPVRRLLFDTPVRDQFLQTKRRLMRSPRNLCVNRASPDFLWYRKNTRLVPVILLGSGSKAQFVLEDSGEQLPIAYRITDMAAALRSGQLFVDRILAYLVRCLLPGVIAVGGTSQQDYVALYQEMLLACHETRPFMDEAEIVAVSHPGASRLGGAPLLELDEEQRETIANLGHKTALDAFLRPCLERTVGETIGDLRCAEYLDVILDKMERETQ